MVMMLGRLRRAAWRRRRAQGAVGVAVVMVVFAAACGEGSVTGPPPPPPPPPSKETAEILPVVYPVVLPVFCTFVVPPETASSTLDRGRHPLG